MLPVPSVVNGRIAKAAQVDRYKVHVTPGEPLLFELQSRELGTSALDGLITVFDEKGTKLASSGRYAARYRRFFIADRQPDEQ